MKMITIDDYKIFEENLIKNAPTLSPTDYLRKKSICCSNYQFLGYSVPSMRVIAKEILRDGGEEFLKIAPNNYYEIVMIKGFVISGMKDKNFVLINLENFVKTIDSWSICDSVITNFKCFEKNVTEQDFLMFEKYALDEREFYSRFGIMMIFRYLLKEENLDRIFNLIKSITNHKYYIDMAIAWLICECMTKYEVKTYELIKEKCFTKFIQNKAISKCRDSFRISNEMKEKLIQYRI